MARISGHTVNLRRKEVRSSWVPWSGCLDEFPEHTEIWLQFEGQRQKNQLGLEGWSAQGFEIEEVEQSWNSKIQRMAKGTSFSSAV